MSLLYLVLGRKNASLNYRYMIDYGNSWYITSDYENAIYVFDRIENKFRNRISICVSSVGRASALQAEGHRFEPCILHHESLAQSVEHLTFNQRVDSSSLSRLISSILRVWRNWQTR